MLNNIKDIPSILVKSEEALNFFQQSLTILRQMGDELHTAICLNSIGLAYVDLGEKEKGLDYFQEAIEVFKGFYNGSHPNIAYCLNNVGATHILLGESEIALNYLNKADKMMGKSIHPHTATCINNIGAAYINLAGREREEEVYYVNEALKHFQQALDIRKEVYKSYHRHIIYSLNNMSAACAVLRKVKESLNYLFQMITMRKEMISQEADLLDNQSDTIDLDTENAGLIYVSFVKLMMLDNQAIKSL